MFLVILLSQIIFLHASNLRLSKPYESTDSPSKSGSVDTAIGFETLSEYRSFLKSNDLAYSEPGYLVKCLAANKNKRAACLDGSPQAFYYRRGANESAHKFHIHLEGGGWCSGLARSIGSHACPQTCYDRSQPAKSPRGSSIMDPPYLYYPSKSYLSNDASANPLSWDWNSVYVRYCDGASFSGNNDSEVLTEDGDPLYFKGFNNLNAVLDILRDEYDLFDAIDVLLTGNSAGGLAVYLHADYIASYIGVERNDINFMAMADAGWFMDYEGNGKYADCMRWIFEAQNTSIVLNQKCLEKNKDGYKCMFAQHTTPFIESKLMAIQSRFDSWQIGMELVSGDESEINAYGQQLEKSMMENFVKNSELEQRERMLYLDSCKHHSQEKGWENIAIDGLTAAEVEYDFWCQNSSDLDKNTHIQKEAYPCDDCCSTSAG